MVGLPFADEVESVMDRRTFTGNVAGGLLAVPLASRAQKLGVPVIGFIGSVSPDAFEQRVAGFRQGLAEIGCTEEQNVATERPEPVFLNLAIMPTKEESWATIRGASISRCCSAWLL